MKKKLPKIVVSKNKKVTDVMKENSAVIVDYIIDAIETELSTDTKEIDIFTVKFEVGLPSTIFKLRRESWPGFLNKMMTESIQSENYELSGKIKKTLEKIGNFN